MTTFPKILLTTLIFTLAANALAAEPPQPQAADGSKNDPAAQVVLLKSQLAEQQKQIEQLRVTLAEQEKVLDRLAGALPAQRVATMGEVASLIPVVSPGPIAPDKALITPVFSSGRLGMTAATMAALPPAQGVAAASDMSAPLQLKVGDTSITPVGFMDLTAFWRDKNAASSMGSNFGSIPYNNTVNGNLSEFHFSTQNSRIGFRVDGNWKGAHFIGYNEFDFNGTSGATNLATSNGAIVPRLRLFWVDTRKDKLEFLAGQSWSMLVPNRKGISALPGALFYTQVIDINYVAGLTWTRQPGMRVLYHPNNKLTFGLSAEQPDQYSGGSAGGSPITLPSAFAGLNGTQLDNAQNISLGGYLAEPGLTPDFIAKIAFDPSSKFHFEVTGFNSNFRTVNPSNLGQHFSRAGGGFQIGANAEVIKNVRLVSNIFWSDGGGRYLFGQAPSLIVRNDGSLSLIHSGSTVDGVEATLKNTFLYAYYSGIYIGRNTGFDANGTTRIGYGYSGSANNMNRAINEVTFGFNQTLWKDAKYGALNAMGQYEYLMRNPWYVAPNAPKATHDNTIYFNLRYTLPGSAPPVK